MRLFIFLVFVLLGIGRNLPFPELFFYGLGVGDFLFFLLLAVLLVNPKTRTSLSHQLTILRVPIAATAALVALALLSMLYNMLIYGVDGKDFFEILRYCYLLTIMVVACHCTRVTGIVPAIGFVLGVIVSGVVAFLHPMNPDVLGTRQIFNPNVIGNILSVSIVFCSFIILSGAPIVGGLLAVCAALISFFTFSKGTWLMSAFALIACFLSLVNLGSHNTDRTSKFGKYFAYLIFASMLFVVYEYWDSVSLIVEAKIIATDFDASAEQGGSVAARSGLILSAIYMFLKNPLLGVGISNFEQVNQLLASELGSLFYEDNNPNSAWFYVLGCMGLPAFLLFTSIFCWFLRKIYWIPLLIQKIRFPYITCIGIVFFIGGNVQVEMLTAYYYWIALGMVAALSTYAKAYNHCADDVHDEHRDNNNLMPAP